MNAGHLINVLRKLPQHPEMREQIAAFASHFALNLSLFAIVIAASFLLSPAEFAHFSLANNYIMLGAMLMDFGLNTAALKLAIEGDRQDYLDINLALKTGLFVVLTAVFSIAALAYGPVREIAILNCSAGLACWYATRYIEQYKRLFWRYSSLNLQLAASRILFGGLSLATHSWMIIVFAIHVVALLPICLSTIISVMRSPRVMRAAIQVSTLKVLARLAPAYFLASALYSAIPLITQNGIFIGDDVKATGAFGLVVFVVGPIALLTNTLRIYVQPQIMLKSLQDVDVFGLGRGSLHVIVGAYFAFLLIGILPASFILEWFYHDRFPQAGVFLLIYGSACCVVDALGLYNMRVLRGGLIWVALIINVVRAAFAALPLLYPGIDALIIVAWSATVLVVGEIVLWLIMNWIDRKGEAGLVRMSDAER